MKRKIWLLIIIALMLVAALAVAFFLLRFPSPTTSGTSLPNFTVSSPSQTVPTADWDGLPTVTSPSPGEPTLPSEALAMQSAPTATPSPIPPPPSPTQTLIPTPTPVPATGYDDVPMVEVSDGEFIMGTSLDDYGDFFWEYAEQHGSDPTAFADEIPHLLVSLSAFAIDQLEVTNIRYRRCVQANMCPVPSAPLPYYRLPDDYTINPSYDDYPVLVTGLAAQAYCQWVGKRLPTEAEWEKAARGTDGRLYPWGNEWNESLIALDIGPVGSYSGGASPYGALDMVGSVAEWTGTRYALYPGVDQLNPDLPNILEKDSKSNLWTVRGYALREGQRQAVDWRVAVRWTKNPSLDQAGFRCVERHEPVAMENILVRILDPIPTPVPTLASGPSWVDTGNAVYVPAGEFVMGVDEALGNPERSDGPLHIVYLNAFYIDRTEVTVGEYVDFLNDMLDKAGVPGLVEGCAGYKCSDWGVAEYNHIVWYEERLGVDDKQHADYPIQRVSWYGGDAYCRWVGGRLPTEAEWEKAARGTDGRRYPWGNTWQEDLITLHPRDLESVGNRPGNASPYGALNMLGSVEEWVNDYFADNYYIQSPYSDPPGPEWSTTRVTRGVQRLEAATTGVTFRANRTPDSVLIGLGFRCAYDTP